MTLRARTTWLDSAVDLLTVAGADGWLWERDRAGLAARGAAVRIPVRRGADAPDAVNVALGAIEVDDEVGVPGSGPVAFGALPFDNHQPAELVIPEIIVGRTADGRSWITTVGSHADGQAVLEALSPAPAQDPDGFELASPVPHDKWMAMVADAVGAIEAGRFSKVVLAREVVVTANRRLHVPTVLRRLRSLYPACTVLAADTPGGRFVAASPELLVSRRGDEVRSHPLAGTIPRSGDPDADGALAAALLASAKDRAEHDWVVRDVESALAPWCVSLDVPPAPSIVSLRNVSHLGTLVQGRLAPPSASSPPTPAAPPSPPSASSASSGPSALRLAVDLHPTAAVGGTPRDAALDWLRAHEELDRGPYAGPVGWVDAKGDGEWVVGIRSAVIAGAEARLYAGVGVVDGSDPATELAETQFKLQALLAAIVRP